MDELAKKISNYVIKDTNLDYEVIKYGVDAILSTILCFSIALIVCTLLGNFIFGLLFICFLTPIKMQFVGYHCKTMIQCITTYSVSAGCLLTIFNQLINYDLMIPISLFLILMCCLTYIVRKELNMKTFIYICAYTLFGCVVYLMNSKIYLIFMISVLFEFILLLMVHKSKIS